MKLTNPLRTKKTLIAAIMAGLASLTNTSSMDFQHEDAERTKLINIKNIKESYDFSGTTPLSFPVSTLIPFFPGDVWKNIIYQWVPTSKTDKTLQWDIHDAISLSLTCRGLHVFINSLETYTIARKIITLGDKYKNFIKNIDLISEPSAEAIQEIKGLVASLKDIAKKIEDKKAYFKKNKTQEDLNENLIIKEQIVLRNTTHADLKKSFGDLSKYSEENPECCIRNDIILDMTDMASELGIVVPSYMWDCRRDFKRIFRDKRVIIGGTLVLGVVFLCKGIELYKQYIAAYNQNPEPQANEAFAAMLNQTSKFIDFDYWGMWGEPIPCFEKYFFNTGYPWTWWDQKNNQWLYFPSDNSYAIYIPGNMTQWIQQIADKGGFNFTYWFNHVNAIFHGLRHNPEMTLCSINTDGTSISCGSAFTFDSQLPQRYWNCLPLSGESICFQLIRGDATCAHDNVIQAHNMTIQAWRTTIGLYWGFGGFGTLLFVWLWIVQWML